MDSGSSSLDPLPEGIPSNAMTPEQKEGRLADGDCADAEVATVTSGLIGIVTVLISSEETGLSKSPNITVICDIRTFS